MKILDYYSLAYMNLKRNKAFFIKNILLITISVLILMLSSVANDSINNVFDRNIKYNISYRSIYVGNSNRIDNETFIENIEEIEHIQKVVEQNSYNVNVDLTKINNEDISGRISLYGANKSISPEIIKGKKIEDNEKNVCIIPKKLYTGSVEEKIDESKFINGEDLLGKEITISYSKYDYSKEVPEVISVVEENFKIVGIYDVEDNMGQPNECYINFDDVLEISNTILENSNFDNEFDPVIAIVDNSENVEQVLTDLKDLNYYTDLRSKPNETMLVIINILGITISICVLILSLFSIIINSIKTSKDRTTELGLLKALGYTPKNIWKIIVTESFIIGGFSYLLACIISFILYGIINIAINNSNFEIQKLQLIINYIPYIYCLIIAIIVPMFGNVISSIKIVKKSAISNSKE